MRQQLGNLPWPKESRPIGPARTKPYSGLGTPAADALHGLLKSATARLMKMLAGRGVRVEEIDPSGLAMPDAEGEAAQAPGAPAPCADGFLIVSIIDRYSRGGRTPDVVRDSDGSLIIHLRYPDPDGAASTNWSPVPRGRIKVSMRFCLPLVRGLEAICSIPAIHPG